MADKGQMPERIHLGLRLIRWDSDVIHYWIENGCVAASAREVSDEG
jgi:predicted DNA-binding transcriptional regulator AlpA